MGLTTFPRNILFNDAAFFTESLMSMVAFFQFEGQVSVFFSKRGDLVYVVSSLNLLHLVSFPAETEAGVLGVVPGQIGLIQAQRQLN